MTLGMIWAQAHDRVIGRDNDLPWHLPEDLRHFRRTTAGDAVVMGRRQWESLPEKIRPLPGRRNVVLSRNPDYRAPGAELVGDLLPSSAMPGAARLGAEEMGILLSYLSTKVLGQFDPFTADEGHLLLVAPNILHVERQLDLDAIDFRRWVCLHEQTHAVQFAAAPWLKGHLAERIRRTVTTVSDADRGPQRLGRTVRALIDAVTGPRDAQTTAQTLAGPLVDGFLNADERAQLAEVVAVMSLLEGHADVVMDAVGPRVLPSVRRIRRQFERRRQGTGTLDVITRRLMGMDAKIAQYRNGAGFVPNRREAREYNPSQIWVQAFGDTAGTMITNTSYSHRSATVSPEPSWWA